MQRWTFVIVLGLLAALAAPVLGQGSRAQMFAPGVVSTGDDEWGFAMSQDGRSVWFNKAERSYRYQPSWNRDWAPTDAGASPRLPRSRAAGATSIRP